jgi:NAD+ synthase
MIDLTINTGLAKKILTGFIHSEITRSGFGRAVIGLSGGIDSALSCYLAAQALGPENVLAIRMPYKTSSPKSLEHAGLVIEDLQVQSMTIPITEMADPFFERIPDITDLRKGNVMARCRMIVLYDQSEAFGGLVVGTGNKTEILLGYSTLYGDSACALNPIGDDLWAGQTDEGELGFTYEQVDQLLYLLVDLRYSPEDCIEAGFPEDFVATVINRVQRFQYKRILPPIAKLSNRTIGYDFLYLRDWGT